MNRFKQEQRNIFGELRMSDDRKKEVLRAVPVKKRSWLPIGAVAAIAAICLFFVMNGIQSDEGYSQAGAIAAYETFLKENGNNMHGDIRHVELPFEGENDAVIVGIYEQEQEDGEVYYFQHMAYEGGKWTFGLSGAAGLRPTNENGADSPLLYSDYQAVNGDIIFAGMIPDAVDAIFVGEKEVQTLTIDGDEIWIASVPSRGTPVYTVVDGEKKRAAQFTEYSLTTEPPVVYELVGDDYALSYDKDTMHVYGEEYTEFDIAVDPDYYEENPISYPDVVLVEGEDGPEVVRVLATNEMSSMGVSIRKEESSILINEMGIFEPYGWAKAKGHPDYKTSEMVDYGQMEEDEVFVHPDNWLSDGVQGYIKENQVIGKVLGYSITGMKTTWTSTEMALYEEVKQQGAIAAVDAKPQEVARVQLYALLQEDYKAAHALTDGITYEQMLRYFKEIKHDNLEHLIGYYAYMLEKSTFNESGEKLIVESVQSGTEVFEYQMARDGGWKVKFISTIY